MSRVADRFGRAALTYEGATPIQREVASVLADRIVAAGLPAHPRVAEFGCGVGYLHRALAPRLSSSLWVATDLAPAMVRTARSTLPQSGVAAVMDAARPALIPGFDLVCSSLTLQWLADPAAVVAAWRALVKPGGRLAVATLLDGSFAEWRGALAAAGAPDPKPAFASLPVLQGWFAPGARIETLTLTDRHPTALAFARAARAAGIDAGFGRPLDGGAMRRALRALDARGAAITYEVAIIIETVGVEAV